MPSPVQTVVSVCTAHKMKFAAAFVFGLLAVLVYVAVVQGQVPRGTGNSYNSEPGPDGDYVSGIVTTVDEDVDHEMTTDLSDLLSRVAVDAGVPSPEPSTTKATEAPTTTAAATMKSKTAPAPLPMLRPEVVTKNGVIHGNLKTVKTICPETRQEGEKQVFEFLGIPYAKPPTGPLRFKRPVRQRKWSGDLSAKTLPNSCQQTPMEVFPGFIGESQWNPNTNVSEDCLYLNLWVPASVFNAKNDVSHSPSSVVFWIHGGGFYSGTSTLSLYDGSSLAAHQEIIVASAQYRLGTFGFLYFGTDDAPGNMGFLDQNLALRWVNENVGAFGGNPEGVTLMGESAGAASVSYHLLSPLSRNYFRRAILMSGVATAPWAFRSKADATDVSYKIAKEVGCWTDDSRSDISQIVDCLRKAEPKSILSTQHVLHNKILDLPLTPTIDDHFLLDTPSSVLQMWDTKRVDILLGSVADEGTYFPLYFFPKYFNRQSAPSITYDVFITTLRDIFKDRPIFERNAIIAQYTNWKNLEDGVQNHKRISEAIGDAFFVCPGRDFAQKWAGRGLNAYYYSFDHRSSRSEWPEWTGVMHGDEIEFAFGQPIGQFHRGNDVDVSLKFMELLGRFIKEGSPSDKWEKYTTDSQVYLAINGTTLSDQSSKGVFGPRATKCAFWNNYLPRLRQTVEKAGSCHARPAQSSHGHHGGKNCRMDRAPPLITRNNGHVTNIGK